MYDPELIEQQAIDAALSNRWEDAIRLNEQMLKNDSGNLSAILRLGYAFLQNADLRSAKKIYEQALKIQPRNQSALTNLERIAILEEKKETYARPVTILDPNMFLEIPGKTKAVTLVTLGQKDSLVSLSIGQEIQLVPKSRKVEARYSDEYVGCLPDDVSKRLLFFINAGSEYKSYVKEASLSRVVIFIAEQKKGESVSHYSSFPSSSATTVMPMPSDDEDATDSGESDESTGEGEEIQTYAENLTDEREEEIGIVPHEESDDEEE